MLGSWQSRRVPLFPLLIGTILSARSRDEQTEKIATALLKRYPTPKAMARANRRVVERILKPIGFYRVKAGYVIDTARKVHENGSVPRTLEGLMALPGVGRKVANCVLVFGLREAAIPVDTHVHRISNRLQWVKTRAPEQTERALVKMVPRRYWLILNEVFVAHGKAVCRPIGPRCGECSVARWCPTGAARAASVPRAPSRPRARSRGSAARVAGRRRRSSRTR